MNCPNIPGVVIDPTLMINMLPRVALGVLATRYAETVADFGRRGLSTDGTMSDPLQLKYKEALEYGVLYRAFLMKGNDWYDKEQGLFYKAEYEKEIKEAWVAESSNLVRHYLPNASDAVIAVHRQQAIDYLVRKASVTSAQASAYADVVDYGTLWYALLVPDQEWSNPGTGAYFEKLFKEEVQRIRIGGNPSYAFRMLPDIEQGVLDGLRSEIEVDFGKRTGLVLTTALKDKYKEGLEYGVLWRAYAMPGQLFSDLVRAEYYERQYVHEITEARATENIAKGYVWQVLPNISDELVAQNEAFILDDMGRRASLWDVDGGAVIPPSLKAKYKKAIEYGTLARSLMMTDQDWYDPKKAEYYQGLYDAELSKAQVGESDDYLKQMLPEIPAKTLASVWSQALVEFARRSERWRYVYETLKVFKEGKQYQINKMPNQEIVRVDSVFALECCTSPNPREWKLPERQDVQRNDDACPSGWWGNDQFWYEPEPGTLLFTDEFEREGCLRVTVVLCPEHGSAEFPPALLNEFKKVLEYGALYKAYMIPNQPWSDVKRAGYYEAKFEEGITVAKRKHKNDMQPGRQTFSGGRYANEYRGSGFGSGRRRGSYAH